MIWEIRSLQKNPQKSREIEANVIMGGKAVADFTMLVWRVVHIM